MDLSVLSDFLKEGNVVCCSSVDERERLLDMAEASGLTLGFNPSDYHDFDWPYVYYDDEFNEVHIRLCNTGKSSLAFSDLIERCEAAQPTNIIDAFDAMFGE